LSFAVGSTVVAWLLFAPRPVGVAALPTKPSLVPEQAVNILLVDDSADDVSLVRGLLDRRWDGDFRMTHVEDVATAISFLAHQRFDAVLLDLTLKDTPGLSGFLQIYAKAPHLPVIVLSGYHDDALATKAVQAGAQDYLVKSHLTDDLLVRSVRYGIERAGREHAEEALRMTTAKFRVARDIQRRLFPARAPSVPGYELAGLTSPADETGGDFYDYIPLRDGRLGLVVADVSNHGLGSALLMAETRAYLRALVLSQNDAGEILGHVNRILATDTAGRHFVTLFFAQLDPVKREIHYAGAGHAAYLCCENGPPQLLESTSLPLGIDEQLTVRCEGPVKLHPGQVFFVCTDGVQEAQSPSREMFSTQRALAFVQENLHRPAAEIASRLYDAVRQHMAGAPLADDVTVLVLKVLAE
jgi:sigma-B regulation protein RsbU (phosphoserine phosphatase)